VKVQKARTDPLTFMCIMVMVTVSATWRKCNRTRWRIGFRRLGWTRKQQHAIKVYVLISAFFAFFVVKLKALLGFQDERPRPSCRRS